MAYTIIEQPQEYTPAYNNIVYRLFSSNGAQAKFKFCIDLYLKDDSVGLDEYLGRFRTLLQVNRTNLELEGFFNLTDILKNAYPLTTYPQNQYQQRAYYIHADLGEEYAASATGAVTYYPAATADFVVYNGALGAQEFRQYDHTDLIDTTIVAASSGVGINALTSMPFPRVILRSTWAELGFLINGNAMNALFTYYNGNTVIGTQEIIPDTTDRVSTEVSINPDNISIPDAATRFTVVLRRQSNDNAISPVYEFEFDTSCDIYDKVNVYWQNKYGAEDSFVFNMKSYRNSETQRNRYKTEFGLNNGYDRAGDGVYHSNTGIKHRLNTDWLTEEQLQAMGQLAESNNVFISFHNEYVAGVRASINLTFTTLPFDGGSSEYYIQAGWFLTFNTSNGALTYTDGGGNAQLTPESVITQLVADLQASDIGTYFNISYTGSAYPFVISFEAITPGDADTISSPTTTISGGPTEAAGTLSANVAGVDGVTPQRIPVLVDNNTFEYKKSENEPLFQLELSVTERLSYERQTQ
jgi:hypothetical protein